jgi:peroxiredoxin Q/BCP
MENAVAGDIAEDFTLKDQNGVTFNLYDNLNWKILLVFYPKDRTPVCTRQLTNYQMNKHQFEKLGIRLAAISADSEDSHLDFVSKCSINFPLLADIDKEVCRKYNALNIFGGVKRKLVLVSKSRKIIFENEVISFKYKSFDTLKVLLENL